MTLDPKVHSSSIPVRYGETDQMGVVHHAVFVPYFEVARTEMMSANGLDYAGLERRGVLLTVIDVQVRYLAPARFGDTLEVRTRITRLERVRVRFDYEVLRKDPDSGADVLLVTGWTTLASVNRDLRPQRLPHDVRAVLEHLCDPPAPDAE